MHAATCPECLRPIEGGGRPCPGCRTPYHAECLPRGGCVVAGCTGASGPRAGARAALPEAPVPIQDRILAHVPDALFALWGAALSFGIVTGRYRDAHELCDPLLCCAVLAGLAVYPIRAVRRRNAGRRYGLVAAAVACLALLPLLIFSEKNRWAYMIAPQPVRMLHELFETRATYSSWTWRGRLFYDHGGEILIGTLLAGALAWCAALAGTRRDDRPARTIAVALALPALALVTMYAR